nr:unnamed protein product [Callosobruchus analis]
MDQRHHIGAKISLVTFLKPTNPEISSLIEESFYVDDFLAIYTVLYSQLSKYGFNLRKWPSNAPNIFPGSHCSTEHYYLPTESQRYSPLQIVKIGSMSIALTIPLILYLGDFIPVTLWKTSYGGMVRNICFNHNQIGQCQSSTLRKISLK